MKTPRLTALLALLPFFAASSIAVHAESFRPTFDLWPQQTGFNGYIQTLAGSYREKGLVTAHKDNREISSRVRTQRESDSDFLIFNWSAAYHFNRNNTRIFIATPDDELNDVALPLETGISHMLPNETILTLSYRPKLNSSKTWQDPYLIGEKRSRTEILTEAVRLSSEYIFGTPISLIYDYGQQSFEHDHAGESLSGRLSQAEVKQLQRDQAIQRVHVSLTLPIRKNIYFIPEVDYTDVNAEGDANSYTATRIEMTLFAHFRKFELFVYAYHDNRRYRQHHPFFNTKRQDGVKGFAAGYSYLAPFDWHNTSFDFVIGGNLHNSNIGFYEQNNAFMAFGFTYKY